MRETRNTRIIAEESMQISEVEAEEMSRPTVGIVLFGPKVSDQLSSLLSEELPVRMKKSYTSILF